MLPEHSSSMLSSIQVPLISGLLTLRALEDVVQTFLFTMQANLRQIQRAPMHLNRSESLMALAKSLGSWAQKQYPWVVSKSRINLLVSNHHSFLMCMHGLTLSSPS